MHGNSARTSCVGSVELRLCRTLVYAAPGNSVHAQLSKWNIGQHAVRPSIRYFCDAANRFEQLWCGRFVLGAFVRCLGDAL